jgi:monofunctional biosynthetic peptidoglycan transglycosylase
MAEKKKKGIWFYVKRVFLWLFFLQLGYIFFCKWINPPITVTQLTNAFEGDGLQRDYIAYDEMGSNIKLAVMASEDQLFPDHNGFDVKSIKKAMKYNERHPKKTRGASTISQQTAKNVFLWQHGGFFRKGLEVYFTFMIELTWSKQRILEMYLNVAEMGPGIFGVEAASMAYFHKHAKALSRSEAAKIAACLPNPKKFTVVPQSRWVMKRSVKILKQMNNLEGDEDVMRVIGGK